MDLKFEWDEEKAAINLKKHKVAFEDAVYVFQDDNRIEFYDAEHSEYSLAAEPPVQCGESHYSGLAEPLQLYCVSS